MLIERLQDIFDMSYAPYMAAYFAVLFVALVLRLTANRNFLLEVTNKKHQKLQLIKYLQRELQLTEDVVLRLKNDLDVINKFNKINAERALKAVERSKKLNYYADILENEELSESYRIYVRSLQKVATEINNVEEKAYNIMSKYQLDSKHTYALYSHGELSPEEYVMDLNKKREGIDRYNTTLHSKREKLYEYLFVLLKQNSELFEELLRYKDKNIDHKKFYFRHMSFA